MRARAERRENVACDATDASHATIVRLTVHVRRAAARTTGSHVCYVNHHVASFIHRQRKTTTMSGLSLPGCHVRMIRADWRSRPRPHSDLGETPSIGASLLEKASMFLVSRLQISLALEQADSSNSPGCLVRAEIYNGDHADGSGNEQRCKDCRLNPGSICRRYNGESEAHRIFFGGAETKCPRLDNNVS